MAKARRNTTRFNFHKLFQALIFIAPFLSQAVEKGVKTPFILKKILDMFLFRSDISLVIPFKNVPINLPFQISFNGFQKSAQEQQKSRHKSDKDHRLFNADDQPNGLSSMIQNSPFTLFSANH